PMNARQKWRERVYPQLHWVKRPYRLDPNQRRALGYHQVQYQRIPVWPHGESLLSIRSILQVLSLSPCSPSG
ncbi:hypothetical protein FRB99_003137, partial [Tulasnella sp. 403]